MHQTDRFMPLRIAIFSPMILGVGKTVETYSSQQISLAKAWVAQGHHVDVITSRSDGLEEYLVQRGIGAYIVPALWTLRRPRSPMFLLGGWRKLLFGAYDVIFCSEHYQPTTALACLLSSEVVVYQGQNTPGSTLFSRFVFRLLDHTCGRIVRKRYRWMITKTHAAKDYALERDFVRQSVVPCGVDTERFSTLSVEEKQNARLSFGLDNSAVVWIYAGNLIPRRGLDTALRAFALFSMENPNAFFFIIGDGDDEPRLEILAKSLGIKERISFVGALNWWDLKRYYGVSDIFVFPTQYEIYGLVLLEAIASGLKIITTGCPAAVDLAAQWPHIINFFEVGDYKGLCDQAKKVSSGWHRYETINTEIIDEISWENIAKKILNEMPSSPHKQII